MKLIYEASNSVEGHMILNLLEQAGLHGRIDGEYLQGGVGELPVFGLVRVMVSEKDFDSAKKIILEWEDNQPKYDNSKKNKKKSHIPSGLIGFVFGALFVAILYNSPVTNDGIDYNGDGNLDEIWTYVDYRISKTELDRNLDGKIDYIYRYDRKGLLKDGKSDDNFDGVFETKAYFQNGNFVWSESDTNGDGFFDYQMNSINGVIDTVVFFDVETKNPIKVQKYEVGKLISAKVDTDGDGVFDLFHEYDEIEEIKK